MLLRLIKFKNKALDFIFPQWCVGCGRSGTLICSSCCKSLPKIVSPLCPRCGRPQSSGILCHSCVNWQTEVDGIRSPFRFEGVIRQAIHQLKYNNIRALVPQLARLLEDYLIINPLPAEVIVPVPLHHKRLRERGYNQSLLLAKELGKLIKLPVVDDCLVRESYTPAQAKTLNVIERRKNVANAFSCRNHNLQNKQVLLLDDVCTSGATISACASAIKNSGVNSVWGLVLAREL